ncbi:MAG: methionyl-tRNA formyltransferase [Bacteroidota bacterium]
MANSSKNLRIVFMGTPEIAVASLQAIIKSGYDVVGVVTTPDKPAGRGRKVKQSAVKEYALEQNIKVLQPPKLKDPDFLNELKSLNPDIQVIVAFRKVPTEVWSLPSKGTINMHASLLPDLRGAAPINWAVIYGYKITGVTTFFINDEIDKGNIILKETVIIDNNETAGTLHDKLMVTGAEIVIKTIKLIESGEVKEVPQEDIIDKESVLNPAPKIFKEDCEINWNKKCDEVANFINGLTPYPGAYAKLNINENVGIANYKILKIHCIKENHNYKAGTVLSDGKKQIKIAVIDGFIDILTIQEPGKRPLSTPEYIRGVKKLVNFLFFEN